jgi:Transcriptional regulators
MANLYSAKMISGAGKVARVYQYQLLIMDSNNSFEQEHESLRQLQDQSLEGLIIQPMSRKSADYQKLLENCQQCLWIE